jgi:hypothetical protein
MTLEYDLCIQGELEEALASVECVHACVRRRPPCAQPVDARRTCGHAAAAATGALQGARVQPRTAASA